MADTYAKQAALEEQMGKWTAAALSWARVCEGRPEDAAAHRRTAEALVRGEGDLHRARDYAQRAVELDPGNHRGHLALARVFLAAGLAKNARRELEAAAKLDPADETVKNLLRDLK
jgi:Tfp pilus assembly protein PilF